MYNFYVAEALKVHALINQPLPGDAKTNSENRLVLSHSFSRVNMILGV